MRLDGLKGNEPLKRQLAGPVELPQACIIAGPPGSGRHTLARILAQALVCSRPELEERPCGLCRDCRKAAEGIHPDVIWAEQFTGPEDKGAEVKIAARPGLCGRTPTFGPMRRLERSISLTGPSTATPRTPC